MKAPHDQDWRTVMPFIVGLVSFALLAAANEARGFALWRNYALSGIFLGSIATWAFWHLDVRLPHYIQWIMVAGMLLHYGGGSSGSPDPARMGLFGMHGINGAYHVFGWWDNLTHLVGIAAAGMGTAYLFEGYQLRRRLAWPAGLVMLLATTAALAAGVGVELYEFLGKTVFQTIDQGGYVNTMTDLVFNLLGALIGSLTAVTVNRRVFWSSIQAQWGTQEDPRDARRVPPSMLGFFAFLGIPAAVALLSIVRFAATGAVESPGAYDEALVGLTRGALAGVVCAPLTAMVARELQRRAVAT